MASVKPKKNQSLQKRKEEGQEKRKTSFTDKFDKLDLQIHGVRLPSFTIEKEYLELVDNPEKIKSNYDFLIQLCQKGFKKLGLERGSDLHKKYTDRIYYELDILKTLGFVDYILLVWKVTHFCTQQDIPIGLGRGSAAGSFVLYLLGVTRIDPVKYDLFFERFVSKIRAKKKEVDGVTYLDGSLMCDIDMDVCYYRRKEVLKYLEVEFEGKTSKLRTLNTLSSKLVMKECGKIVDDKSEVEMNRVSSMIPKIFGQVKDVKESYDEVEDFKNWCDDNPKTYKTALKLRGLVKNKGVHPSAILLSHDDILNNCPLELDSDKDTISSFDMNWASIFNVKLDVLGLRTASVVAQACKLIDIKVEDIDLDDSSIYRNLYDLKNPHGIFQVEAGANFRVCQKVKPKNLEELSAVLALARPGAMQFVDQYANYTNNDVYEAIDPFFDDILKSTGGVALYQEQLMQMAHKIGFTLDEAEVLRRIVGKKKVSEVKKWKKKISEKVKENNLSAKIGKILWKVLEDSANYSFNKSHSIAYAAMAAMTVYLKFNHPKEFFLALLQMSKYEPDPIEEISKIHRELGSFDIKLLRPHILKSQEDFAIEGDNIRFGLISIKGISNSAIEKLNSFKTSSSNKFEVFQAATEAGVNLGVLSALIQAGALEMNDDASRSKVVLECQLWKLLTERERVIALKFGQQGHSDLIEVMQLMKQKCDDKGKPYVKESRVETIRKKYEPYHKIYNINKANKDFANWYYENELLGYTYGISLMDIFSRSESDLIQISDMEDLDNNEAVTFVGTIFDTTGVRVSKNGNEYARFDIKDETGTTQVLIFNNKRNNNIDDCKDYNGGKLPEKKSIVLVKGTKKDDAVFADVVTVQDSKIYMKLGQLRNTESKKAESDVLFKLAAKETAPNITTASKTGLDSERGFGKENTILEKECVRILNSKLPQIKVVSETCKTACIDTRIINVKNNSCFAAMEIKCRPTANREKMTPYTEQYVRENDYLISAHKIEKRFGVLNPNITDPKDALLELSQKNNLRGLISVIIPFEKKILKIPVFDNNGNKLVHYDFFEKKTKATANTNGTKKDMVAIIPIHNKCEVIKYELSDLSRRGREAHDKVLKQISPKYF